MNATIESGLENATAEQSNARRDELVVEYLYLVKPIATQVQRSLGVHVELEDLTHAGTMGLFDAASKYADDKQVPFPVYAKHRIRGAILDSLRQLDWASRDARKQYKQIESVTRDLTAKLGRTPSQIEVAENMGLDAKRWQSLMIDYRNCGQAAAQQRSVEREDNPAKEVPCAPGSCPDQLFARSELKQKLGLAMQTLPLRHRKVVELYYERDMTMKEIGGVLGVNESRVSQIHKNALVKMQAMLGQTGVQSSAAFC